MDADSSLAVPNSRLTVGNDEKASPLKISARNIEQRARQWIYLRVYLEVTLDPDVASAITNFIFSLVS